MGRRSVTSLGLEAFTILEAETRFLYPFLYNTRQAGMTPDLLAGLRAFKSNLPVWRPRKSRPDEPYREELLDNVSGFLFPQDQEGGCRSFEVEEAARNSWFRSGIRMSTAKGELLDSGVVCCKIELFLSPYGAGVLSITLRPSLSGNGVKEFEANHLKDFNYQGAQLRGRPMPRFSIAQPEGKFAEHMTAPPDDDAPLRERLGFTGGSFNLGELCKFLLEPIAPHPIQGQFSLYSVVRLDRSVGFDSEATRRDLSPLLAGLAQIEERLHAGAPSGEINVPNRILNSKHWAAVSFLGAVHLVADQGNIEFDHQRLPNVIDKYFAPYLCAFLQRLATYRIIHDAQTDIQRQEGGRRMGNLRREMLSFAVCSNFTEVSSREALNRFYDLSREGLRVGASLSVAKEAILEFDAAEAADRSEEMNRQLSRNVEVVSALSAKLERNIETVADVQTKIEWLEVFFVSFYAAELSELIGTLWGFDHTYTAWAVPIWMIVGLSMAAWGLRPWHRKPVSKRALFVVIAFVIAWFVGGLLWTMPQNQPGHVPSSPKHAEVEGSSS
jgi:hypothetical protein